MSNKIIEVRGCDLALRLLGKKIRVDDEYGVVMAIMTDFDKMVFGLSGTIVEIELLPCE